MFLLPLLLVAQFSSLRVRAIDRDGAAHAAGTRTEGITVEVTDELGKPVQGAVVTVRLPDDDGPGGSFAGGPSSDIVTTGADGRATTKPINWNRLPGAVEIHITAANGRQRAGTIASRTLSDPEPEQQASPAGPERHGPRVILKQKSSRGGGHVSRGGGRLKWILIAAAAAGGAAATLGLRGSSAAHNSQNGGGQTGPVTSITPSGSPVVGPHP